MGARHYGADSETGDRVDGPSEDALFMLISELNDSDNTFVVIQPDEDGHEIVRRDTTRNEHEVTQRPASTTPPTTSPSGWPPAPSGRPASQAGDF